MTFFGYELSEIKKAIVALVGVVAILFPQYMTMETQQLLGIALDNLLSSVAAFFTVAGVFQVRNEGT